MIFYYLQCQAILDISRENIGTAWRDCSREKSEKWLEPQEYDFLIYSLSVSLANLPL